MAAGLQITDGVMSCASQQPSTMRTLNIILPAARLQGPPGAL